MNETFNIKRLGRLIYKELIEKYRIMLGIIIILLAVQLSSWGLTLWNDEIRESSTRFISTFIILSFACYIAPFVIYKNENRRMEGIFYATAPASTIEKTISMIVVTSLVFPITISVICISFDSLLTVMPFETGYRGHLWRYLFSGETYLHGVMSKTPIISSAANSNFSDWIDMRLVPYCTSPLISIALSQSLFVLLNMVFRRNKIGKTIGLLLTLLFLISICTVIFVTWCFNESDLAIFNDPERLKQLMENFMITSTFVSTYVLPVIFWILTYLRIRKIQY